MSFEDETRDSPADLVAALRTEQSRRLWQCIETAVAAGCEVRMKHGSVFVIKPDGSGIEVYRPSLADAAAHALGSLVMDLEADERERGELLDRLVEDSEPLLSPERDLRETP